MRYLNFDLWPDWLKLTLMAGLINFDVYLWINGVWP